jgi:hypothetical protein
MKLGYVIAECYAVFEQCELIDERELTRRLKMDVSELLKTAGFEKEKSTIGDKPILKGTYKASLFDFAFMDDKGYGASVYAQFKITEVLEGTPSNSKFPEFKAYFNLSPDKIASKRNGLAKLINGFFSVGVDVDTTKLEESLEALKGTEVYISAYKQKARKQVDGAWVDDAEGDDKQAFTFLTEKNALKAKEKAQKASGIGF